LIRNGIDDLKRRFGQWAIVHRAALIDLLRAALPVRTAPDLHQRPRRRPFHNGLVVTSSGPAGAPADSGGSL
jgi:hypothetical protein